MATLPPLPDTPTITSQADIDGGKGDMTPFYLPKSHTESSSTHSSPGTTPFKPLSAAEILAQPSPGFEAPKLITPSASNPSRMSSWFSEASTSASASKQAIIPAPAPAASYEEKEKDAAEEKKTKEWLEKYIKAQPSGTLLKVTDPEYLDIMAAWRKDQNSNKREHEKEKAAQAAEREKKADMEKKLKEKNSKWYCFKRS